MKNGSTISLGRILWKVFKHPLATDLTYDDAAEYAIEALELLGAPVVYDTLYKEITISNHKGVLPDLINHIEGIRSLEHDLGMRESTDTFHSSENQREDLLQLTYEIKRNSIFTSIPEGCVEICYKSLPTDEEGYPLIIDEVKTKLAIEYYILFRYLEPLYDIGKITDKAFQRIDQKKCFYMASASNKLKMPSPDQMESLVNTINRMIIDDNAHTNTFRTSGKKEIIKKFR